MSSIPTGSAWRHHLIGCGILCDSGDAGHRRIADELGIEHVIHGGQRVSVGAGKMTVAFSANPAQFRGLVRTGGKEAQTARSGGSPAGPAAPGLALTTRVSFFYAGKLHPRTAAGLAPLMHL
jgi:hypothetical protein